MNQSLNKKVKIITATFIIILVYSISFQLKDFISMTGESLYSFNYLHLLSWIIKDWIENPALILQSHNCNECPGLSMYNRWTMFWFYLILSPGQILKINPLIWYFSIGLALQFYGIKSLTKSLNLKLNHFLIFVTTLLYITIPIRYEQFLNQWEYSFVHGFYMLYISVLININLTFKTIKRDGILNKEIIKGIFSLSGLIIFGIGHLPLTIYLTLLFFVFSNLLKKKISFLLYSVKKYSYICLSAFVINLPVFISIVINQSSIIRYGDFYVGMGWDEAFSLGFIRYREYFSNVNQIPYIILIPTIFFIFFTLFLFAKYKIKTFIFFIAIVLFFILSSIGYSLPFLQEYVPFFSTMRASYRFYFFVQIILLLGFLVSIQKILSSQNHSKKYIVSILFVLVGNLNLLYIFKNPNLPNFMVVPIEYKNVYSYLQNNLEKRFIYFPITLNDYHGFNQDFSWTNKNAAVFFWWNNPFYSWYPARNIHHPIPSSGTVNFIKQIKSFVEKDDQINLVKILKNEKVDYVILDKYYNWNKEFPNFNLKVFTKNNMTLLKDHGELEIYSIIKK